MWQFDGKTDYIKPGRARLADACELLEQPSLLAAPDAQHLPDAAVRHLRGAVYLAGDAIECALKAYILAQAGTQEAFSQVMDRRLAPGDSTLRHWREKAHNLRFLWRVAGLETDVQDGDIDLKKDLPCA